MNDDKFSVTFAPSAVRALESAKIPRRVADAVLMFVRGPLAESPWLVGKPLVAPLDGLWSARRGEFRILYEIDFENRSVRVVAVVHRADAYGRGQSS